MDDPHPYASQLAQIARNLEDKTFSAKCVIEVDSIICMALFGQRTKKRNEHRKHNMQTLSLNCALDRETSDLVYQTYEAEKEKLSLADATRYMNVARDIARRIYRSSRTLKEYGNESRAVSEWYEPTLNPNPNP